MNFHRTRIAPTPSGYLHIGNLLSFALTAHLAQKIGASLLLRIDDMDGDRKRPEYVQDVFDTLRFAGIGWDEGPKDVADFEAHWSQHLRRAQYNAFLDRLKQQEAVYACTCSRAQVLAAGTDGRYPGTCRDKDLPLETPGASWRIRTDNRMLKMHGLSGREQRSLPAIMHDFVVRKKDGLPAYQLCSLADDLHFDVDLIVRGEDLFDSTLAQLFLASVLDEERFMCSTFVHHPLLKTSAGRKLSKSAGDTSVRHYRLSGITSEELMQKTGSEFDLSDQCHSWQELGAAMCHSIAI